MERGEGDESKRLERVELEVRKDWENGTTSKREGSDITRRDSLPLFLSPTCFPFPFLFLMQTLE